MMSVLVMLALPAAWGPLGCPPVGGHRLAFQPAFQPVFVQPQPVPAPFVPDDAIERARAEGRAEARAEMRAARKATQSLCSDACTCGCNDGGACGCGKAARAAPPAFGDDLPTGVDGGKISRTDRYTRNGKEISKAEAVWSVQQVVDDSMKARLTLIGPDAERKALRKALESEAWLRPLVLVQDYDPSSAFVARHRKSGLTVHLQKNTHDGTDLMPPALDLKPSDLAALMDRIKEALGLKPVTPAPAPPAPKGPDGKPATPAVDPVDDQLRKVPLWAWLGLGGAVLLLTRKN